MEWDQYIFKQGSRLVRYLRKEKVDPLEDGNKVALLEISDRLTYLSRLLCGGSMNISSAEYVGGWKGTQFFLPKVYTRGMSREANIDYYLFRVFFMYGQMKLSHYWKDNDEHSDTESYKQSQIMADEVLTYLRKEFDMFEHMHRKVLKSEESYQRNKEKRDVVNYEWLYGRWYFIGKQEIEDLAELINPVDKKTVTDDKEDEEVTEVEGKSKENATVLKVDTHAQEEYTLTHNFEKIETLDGFSGRWRDFDGSDEMDEHQEALEELDLRFLVRVDNPVHSVYKTEFIQSLGLLETTADVKTYHFSYPEWDESNKRYKQDFCQIIYQKHQNKNYSYTQKILKENRKQIIKMTRSAERYLSDYFIKKRLPNGEEPDIDAVVEAYVDIKTGNSPSENLYLSKRKKSKDIAILVLTDCSLSTDGFNNNRRILNVEMEALLLSGEVWNNFNLMFQIDSFSSHTHSQCFYSTYKAFHERWDEVKDRIGAMESVGYTRIGAALRHAIFQLDNVKAETKWLLLLSDGKPNDFDTYEGNYGIYDIRKAIKEAEHKNIHTSAIAIDSSAKYYLPKMFGQNGFTILQNATELPEVLTKFYLNLLK